MGNQYAPDGYRYGVMFGDGSVMEDWNGKTQRRRAEEYLSNRPPEWGREGISLARRLPNGQWERLSGDDTPNDGGDDT